MTVMVVDVGGGTTDVTVHHCEDVGGKVVLAEEVTAVGDICGGVMADEAFRWVAQTFAFPRLTC
jgi:molecular chaperone DnaK (HSP70)